MENLIINGIEYRPVNGGMEKDVRIVILQRGWVYIGYFEREENDCTLAKASCIRIWGTSKGLGELVDGPTSSTKLDKCNGIVEFDWLTVICTITVNTEAWKKHL